MNKNITELINRIALWNTWRTPKDVDYIDYFLLTEGTVSIKLKKQKILRGDSYCNELIIAPSDDEYLSVSETLICNNSNRKKRSDIIEEGLISFHVMNVILSYHNSDSQLYLY